MSSSKKVVHALITSRLDYCNSLYFGIDQCSVRRLQLVQNAAARLLTGTRRRDHITPVLSSLHWLPVVFRIQFKMLLLVFKSLHNLAPSYLTDLLTLMMNKAQRPYLKESASTLTTVRKKQVVL